MLGGHRVEILDDHIGDATGREPDANDLVRLERVDVDLEELLVAHHEHAVRSELEHLLAHRGDRARGAFHQELNVVCALPRRRLGHRRLANRTLGRRHGLERDLLAREAR